MARPPGPVLVHDQVELRLPVPADFPAWHAVKVRDREWLETKQPRWSPHHLTGEDFRRRCALFAQDQVRGRGFAFHIFARNDDRFLGFIHLAPIRYGPARLGTVGYWIAQPEWGQGFATQAVLAVSRFAFEDLQLARLEAHCLPDNPASAKVLEKAGFQREGLLSSCLEINGVRRDHLVYGQVAQLV